MGSIKSGALPQREMGSIKSGALPQREMASIKSGGAAATKNGQDKKRRSEEHTSELQSHSDLVCRLLLEKKKDTGVGNQYLVYTHTTHVCTNIYTAI